MRLSQKVFGGELAPFRFLMPFSVRPSRPLRNSLRSDILAGRPICCLLQIGGIPRGYVPLVAGKVYTLPRRGGRESDRRRTPVGRGKAKLFPLQATSTSLKDRIRRLNLQWSLHPFLKTFSLTERKMLPSVSYRA